MTTRRLFGAIVLTGLMVIALPAATASAASAKHLTRIQRPLANQVVGMRGHVRVVVRSREQLGALRISVNGRGITRLFHGSAGVYSATLRRGRGLHPGVNQLFVETRNYRDFDRVTFIVARRAPKLLTLTGLRVDGREAPVRVKVRVGEDATFHAYLNGDPVDRAFEQRGRGYVGMLGANDGVRPGRNRLVVRADRTRRAGRSAVRDVARATFTIHGVVAGAGGDRDVDAGESIELRGSAVGAGGGVDYHWAIVDAPDGGDGALLEHAHTATPEFESKTPGTYRVRATVRAANGTASAVSAASDASSADTVTVTVRADVPPMGWRLQTAADGNGTIRLNGAAVPGTTCNFDPACANTSFVTYAVFDRQTLDLVASGNFAAKATAITDLANKYGTNPAYLMVVNFSRLFTRDIALNSLIDKIGAGNLDFGTPADVTRTRPVSIVGVSGSPNGSATVSAVYRGCKCIGTMDESNMDGYLRLNGSTGLFEFVRTDLFEFNTDEPTTAGRLRIRLGPNPFTRTLPTDGSSGFLMATVVASNMFPIGSDLFVTNNPDGSENAAEQTRMANALVDNVSGENSSGRILVALQAFGTPKGKGAGWQQIQQGIEKLGGNGQVFAQLNQGRPDEPYQGRYALVGRAAMGVPAAESSQSLAGRDTDGKLRGLLARGRDDQYLPLLADPLGSINFGLVSIVNRAPTSISGFPRYTGGRAAAEQFLARSRDPLIMGVCAPDAPTCDPRKAYYENYFGSGTSWDTILTALGQRAKDACTAEAAKPGAPFSDAECQEVRRQLETEVDARNRVAAYFGPDGLQRPFLGGAGTSAIVNIAAISAAIQSDVQPPVGDNTASHALNIVSFVVKIAGAGGGLVNPAVGTAANGLAAAFGIAGYLTKQDGSPDLIGPDVSKRATDLGVELNERYQRVSSYFTTEAKIVMSDWSKMREVAAAVSEPSWRLNLDDSTRLLDVATKRAIYQALVPTAYPYFYDLGTGVAHAKDWICRSSPRSLYDKNLFQKTGTAAELPYLLPGTAQGYTEHLMAVGAKKAVGSLHGAYIPAPTQELTDKLFGNPLSGGMGFNRLEFFSTQNFRVFPKVLQQTTQVILKNNIYGFWTCQTLPDPPGNGG